jgi:iron(III) transport system substrate-binding protein
MTRTIMRGKFRLAAGALAIGALVLAGCSSSSSSSSSASGTSSAKVTLVVYSAQGYDKAAVAAFQKATGIPVKLDDNSTGPLLTQIEASKNNPNWGLLWVDGATAFAGLDAQGLLLKGFEPSVAWNSLGTASIPADKSYVPTGVTLMAAVVYDKTKMPNAPSTWQQLLQPQYKGLVGMNDPSQSGPTFPFVAGMMNYLGGVTQGESFFTRLKVNGLIIHPTSPSSTCRQPPCYPVPSASTPRRRPPSRPRPRNSSSGSSRPPARRSCSPVTRPATRSSTRSCRASTRCRGCRRSER